MLSGILMGATLMGTANLVMLKHLQTKYRREFDKKVVQSFVIERKKRNAPSL